MSTQASSAVPAKPSAGIGEALLAAQLSGVWWGLLFGIVPAVALDACFGVSLTEPLAQALGPARLWWLPSLGAVAIACTAFGAWARWPVLFEQPQFEAFPTAFGTAMLLWFWLHDAYAFLWPALAFTVLYVTARVARGFQSPVPAKARADSRSPARESTIDPAVSAALESAKERNFAAIVPRRGFDAVLGMQREKRSLMQFARDAQAGQRNGALLFGPPGAGKTYLVEALAGELALPLITVSVAELASKWVYATTEHVAAAFGAARRQSPCVLFFDEIDAVMPDRATASNDTEAPRIVATLLTELASIRGSKVMVLAATNYPERLDAAGTREGRFDLKIEIALPDAATRRAILANGIGPEYAGRIREGALEMAVRHFAGFNIARLSAIAQQARKYLLADKTGRGQVQFAALLRALRSLQGLDFARRYEGVPPLEDIVLARGAREQIVRLAKRMRDIEETERQDKAARLPLGAVFYGPPGTGKTLVARALAKAAQWSFIATNGHDLMREDTAMDKILERASNERPVIVFIDEADDILGERTMAAHTQISTNKLLTLIDGANGPIPDVFYIAATNHPGALDKAASRRFSLKIAFCLPEAPDIARYVRGWLAERDIPCAPELTPGVAARILAGRSMADIKEVLREAVNIAIAERVSGPAGRLSPGDVRRALRSLSFNN